MSDATSDKLRVDKWLWFARFFKTRTLASGMVSGGHMRVNSQPVRKPGHMVKLGDILTFPQGPHIRVIEIISLAERRGSATIAQGLYRDLDPPQPRPRTTQPETAAREKGSGRPTKKERRETDRLKTDL
mgnify:CR=1 FL=1